MGCLRLDILEESKPRLKVASRKSESALKVEQRFMRVDPLADDPDNVSWSPYAYVWNNPIRFIDPLGLKGVSIDTKYKNKATGEVVEVDDGIDKTIVVNESDFQKAKFFANELNNKNTPIDQDIIEGYKEFYDENNGYEELSLVNALDYLYNRPKIVGEIVGGTLPDIGGVRKKGGKKILKSVAKLRTQRHHIIPKQIFKRHQKILKPFLKRDGAFNLRNLPTPFHGNHPQYNRYVGKQIQEMIRDNRLNEKSVRALHEQLNTLIDEAVNSGMKLNDYFRKL